MNGQRTVLFLMVVRFNEPRAKLILTLEVGDKVVKNKKKQQKQNLQEVPLVKMHGVLVIGGDAEAVFKEKHGAWDPMPELTLINSPYPIVNFVANFPP